MSRQYLAAMLFLANPFIGRAQGFEWETSLDRGLEIARARSQPVLVDFSADWCPPCRDMDERIWTEPELASTLRSRVVPVRIDFDAERKLVRRFRVTAIPTVIWVDPWGSELGRNVGFTDVGTLLSVIESLPGDYRPIASFQALASLPGGDGAPLVRIASFYREKGFLVAADSHYERALGASKQGKRGPTVAEQAYVGLGLNELARGRAKEARKRFERALKLPPGPNRANALYGLVDAHVKLGELKRAETRLEELRSAYPNDEKTAAAHALVAGLRSKR